MKPSNTIHPAGLTNDRTGVYQRGCHRATQTRAILSSVVKRATEPRPGGAGPGGAIRGEGEGRRVVRRTLVIDPTTLGNRRCASGTASTGIRYLTDGVSKWKRVDVTI